MSTDRTKAQAAYEMIHMLHERRRMLDDLRRAIDIGETQGALSVVHAILRRIQTQDEQVAELHREAISLVAYCKSVLETEALRRPPAPIIIQGADTTSATPRKDESR
jgi:ubiquinone biosynthesis protein COQ9